MLIENFLAIYKMSKESICETAAEDFRIALLRERGFEDSVNSGLDFRSAFVKSKSACSLVSAPPPYSGQKSSNLGSYTIPDSTIIGSHHP